MTKENNFDIDGTKKMKIRAANNSVIHSAGEIQVVGESTKNKNKADMNIQVTKDMTNEMLVSYSDLKSLKALPKNFPFAACNKVTQKKVEADKDAETLVIRLKQDYVKTVSDDLPR